MHSIKTTWAVKKPHCLLKFNPVQKEIFMKNRVTKGLALSALVIGMPSTVERSDTLISTRHDFLSAPTKHHTN